MTFKSLIKPNKYNIIIFIILFSIIFFIPYIKSTPAPDAGKLILPGHYPLIFIFLASLVVLMDLLTGNIELGDLIFFSFFLLSFFITYLLACILSLAIFKKNKIIERQNNADNEPYKDRYVLNLEEQTGNDKEEI